MRTAIENDITPVTPCLFELFECAMIEYLNLIDRENILPKGGAGPEASPSMFRSCAITALAKAKDNLATPQGRSALQTMRKLFPSTEKALQKVGLVNLWWNTSD